MIKYSERTCNFAKTIMELAPAKPHHENDRPLWESNIFLSEIFNLREFTQGSNEDRKKIMLASSQYFYDDQAKFCYIENLFNRINPSEFHGKSVLDLGCFTGGTITFWKEKYQFGYTAGLDVNSIYTDAGKFFSASKHVEIEFQQGFGENIPFIDNTFDFIISTEVFEHVHDLEKVMNECLRILKPGGKILVTFPQYHNLINSHLMLVTKIKGIQWIFSGKTIAKAVYAITQERGDDAYWYKYQSPQLQNWERSPHVNGTTVRKFMSLIRKQKWFVISWNSMPEYKNKALSYKILYNFLHLLSKIPIIEEYTLLNITCILQKPLLNE